MAGAIHERTASGVPRLAIHPQPSPDTSERTAITATEMAPPLSSDRTRWRHSTPGPAQSQAM